MISIIVCTHNRAELLSRCLRSLARQTVGKENYEVIVVDNASTDGTSQVVREVLKSEPNFSSCVEVRRGANYSRNAGARLAQGEYLAFIDDDAFAYDDWIATILDFSSRHPEVTAFGGPYDAYSSVPLPDWFPPEYGTLFLGVEERPIRVGDEWITGTNLIVRKDAFKATGGFHDKLGSVKNGIFYYGEEIRLIVELSRAGYEIYYVPSIRVRHFIRDEKINLKHLILTGYQVGRTSSLTVGVKKPIWRHLAGVFIAVAKGVLAISTCNRTPVKRKTYYALYPILYELAALVESVASRTTDDYGTPKKS